MERGRMMETGRVTVALVDRSFAPAGPQSGGLEGGDDGNRAGDGCVG